MIEYRENNDLAFIDGYMFRRDKNTNYFLSSKKINGKRKRLHIYIWEKEHGQIPKNCHVHHINGNKLDNEISNLTLLSRSEHLSFHAKEKLGKLNKEEMGKRMDNAREKANEWHKSEQGRAWHKAHYKESGERLYKEKSLICEQCGKAYKTIGSGKSRFCSSGCKSKWRRNSGLDDEIRKCEYCGKEFKINKYAKKRFCSCECEYKAVPRGGNTYKNKKH